MRCLQVVYKYHIVDGRTIKTKDKTVKWEIKKLPSSFSGDMLWQARVDGGHKMDKYNHWTALHGWNQADIQQAYEKYLSNLVLM
jgi:hypothetical protein